MAVESPIKQSDHWFIGEDKTLRYYVTKGKPIIIGDAVAVGDTSITVEPLKEAITSGDKLRFGEIVLTTTAGADAGDVSVAVSATVGTMLRGEVGYAIQNVTGWTFDWVLKANPTTTATVLTKTPSITTATSGVVDVAIEDTDTDALVQGTYYYRFRRADAGSETVLAFGQVELRL